MAAWDDQVWDVVDQAVQRIEQARLAGEDADLTDILPSSDDPQREQVLLTLIKVDQEDRWRHGERKTLEGYLQEWPELANKPKLLAELLEAECTTRASVDTIPAGEEIRARFPNIWQQVDLRQIQAKAAKDRRGLENGAASEAVSDTSAVRRGETVSTNGCQASLKSGDRFGRYEIGELLGEGGMGAVYRAFDSHLEREVALKIPRFDATADPEAIDRFVREARATAKIEHPNICTIYDAGEIDGMSYLTMALVDGDSLRFWSKDRKLSWREIATIALKLAQALAKVHGEGIVHRDIKPSNVMMTESGEPLLTDFGLARLLDRGSLQHRAQARLMAAGPIQSSLRPGEEFRTVTGDLLGALPYMSPQQVDGQPGDFQSDVYSLGVMMYELMTGERPFSGDFAELVAQIVGSQPAKPSKIAPGVDSELEKICLKAMAKEPQERYQSAEALALALQRHLRRLPRWIKIAGTTALALLAGIVIFLRTGDAAVVIDEIKGATVKIDGEQLEIQSSPAKVRLSVGSHQIVISKGKQTHKSSITIRWRGDSVTIRPQWEPIQPVIFGAVWNDVNGDGEWDRQSEDPLEGWKVYLDANSNGFWDPSELFEMTDAEGYYTFGRLPAGTYKVCEVMPGGWEQTHPSAIVYQTDFSSDPGWITNNSKAYAWSASDRAFAITQTNINGGGEYAYHETSYGGASFHLEFDVQMLSNAYASDVRFGLIDSDLHTDEQGSFAVLLFTRPDQGNVVCLNYGNSENALVGTMASKRFSYKTWYHVAMSYDADVETLRTQITDRDRGVPFAEVSMSKVGSFSSDMSRVGTSNVRQGTFQEAGAKATGKIDNVVFSVARPRVHEVKIDADQIGKRVDFGNRKLGEIHGKIWIDTDGNGVCAQGELGREGCRVYVDENLDGNFDDGERSTTADYKGAYSLVGISAGSYVVAATLEKSKKQTYPVAYDWKQYRGHLYAVTKRHSTWDECELEAVAAGGHLATINDADENNWLAETFRRNYLKGYQGNSWSSIVWIGLHQRMGNWAWISGETKDFSAKWWPVPQHGPQTEYGYLHTAEHPSPRIWGNQNHAARHQNPRGVIELATDIPGVRGHPIILSPGEIRRQVDFGETP